MPSILKSFGAGIVTFTPSIVNPTPVQIATLKDVSLDISFTEKELRGANVFPEDVARAGGKIAGKAKSGRINGGLLSLLLTGATQSTGRVIPVPNEIATIPTTPFTVTATQGANFDTDLGVIDLNTGLSMVRVASAPATGQYAVNTTTGVYTFAAADTGHQVALRYLYKSTTLGTTLDYTNQLMGTAQTFEVTVFNSYAGGDHGFRLYACTIPKLALAYKNEDYTDVDIDFSAFANTAGKVLSVYQS